MSQNKQPEDLSALEEYYRRQLLEYSRRASVTSAPAAPPDAPAKKADAQPVSRPVKPPAPNPAAEAVRVNAAKSPEIQPVSVVPKQADAAPSAEKTSASGQEGEKRNSFRGESFPGAGVLPRAPKVLRTASVVQPLPGSGDTGIGHIKARVTTGSGAVPIEGAVVLIERMEGDTSQLVDQLVTDGSGNTPVSQPLPTAPVSQSLSPGLDATPYAVYQVRIRAKGFSEYVANNVLVFDGELSLVDANMLPQRENLQQSGEVRDA